MFGAVYITETLFNSMFSAVAKITAPLFIVKSVPSAINFMSLTFELPASRAIAIPYNTALSPEIATDFGIVITSTPKPEKSPWNTNSSSLNSDFKIPSSSKKLKNVELVNSIMPEIVKVALA